MPSVTLQVSANWDDVYETETGGAITNGTRIQHDSATSGAGRRWGAHRWTGTLPRKGETITTCYLSIYLYSITVDDINGNIHFEKAASPAQFSSTAFDVTDRTRTAASVSWVVNSLGTGWKNSPSLVTPMQELVDAHRPTAIVLIFRPNTNIGKQCVSYSYEEDSTWGAKLYIAWDADPLPTPGMAPAMTAKMVAGKLI